ncbi:MAG: hypothetical protein Greene041619_266 [Candidatus Peregrinibacteria bacterium Greene0416_19]|nr:MAG: hypothetical protein Greene041619_266 [Candidatus Peregrinibacteria bacterium Greene0416_19]
MHAKNLHGSDDLFTMDRLYLGGDERVRKLNGIQIGAIKRLTRQAAIEDVLRNPDYAGRYSASESFDPPAEWIRDIHFRLTQMLKLQDWSQLKIFPAPKTSASVHHHIDFIIEFCEPESDQPVYVTVDASLNRSKIENGYKADIVVSNRGAIAGGDHEDFATIGGVDIPEFVGNPAPEDEREREESVRQGTAQIIFEVLQKKIERLHRARVQGWAKSLRYA